MSTTSATNNVYAQPFGNQSMAKKTTSSDQALNKDTFLSLLVAQLKNQNPLNPADGVQFLTQLAQFTELEQMMSIRQDVAAIRGEAKSATDTSTSGSSGTGASSNDGSSN